MSKNMLIIETLKTVCNSYIAAGYTEVDIFDALNDLTLEYFSKLEEDDDVECIGEEVDE